MSYFSQMVGLCAQNFLAGAAGLAVGVAFIRGLARQCSDTLGNFWVDLTRALLWILLPGALLGAMPVSYTHLGGTLRAELFGWRCGVGRGHRLHSRSCQATLRHAGQLLG